MTSTGAALLQGNRSGGQYRFPSIELNSNVYMAVATVLPLLFIAALVEAVAIPVTWRGRKVLRWVAFSLVGFLALEVSVFEAIAIMELGTTRKTPVHDDWAFFAATVLTLVCLLGLILLGAWGRAMNAARKDDAEMMQETTTRVERWRGSARIPVASTRTIRAAKGRQKKTSKQPTRRPRIKGASRTKR